MSSWGDMFITSSSSAIAQLGVAAAVRVWVVRSVSSLSTAFAAGSAAILSPNGTLFRDEPCSCWTNEPLQIERAQGHLIEGREAEREGVGGEAGAFYSDIAK